MIIGFTGTRHGLTEYQQSALRTLLLELSPAEFHHGSCAGADTEAHDLVRALFPECIIHVHPGPDGDHWRTDCVGNVHHDPKTHFARNRDIVQAADVVIGTPQQAERQTRGGTWYTLDYAAKQKKRVIIICPDGTVQDSEGDG